MTNGFSTYDASEYIDGDEAALAFLEDAMETNDAAFIASRSVMSHAPRA